MEPKKVVLYGGLTAVIALLLSFTDLTDKIVGLSEKLSDHVRSTEICSEGESIHVKADSRTGRLIAKKLNETFDHRCRVFPPTAPSSLAEKPAANEIKFFHGKDADKAVDLAIELLRCCQIEAKPKYLPKYAQRDIKRYHVGYFEVWLR